MKNPRKLAFDSLLRCEKDGKYSNLEVASRISSNDLSNRDKSLYTALVYGVIEKRISLDALISHFSKREVSEIDRETLTALRLGLYQIAYMDRIPLHSACDEAVKLVKGTPVKSSAPFVNAVLRSASKEKESFEKILKERGESAYWSMPDFIISLWKQGYGEDKANELFEAFQKKPPVTLRVNTLKISANELFEKLLSCGANVQRHSFGGELIVLLSGAVDELYGYNEGYFFVQGTGSYMAVKALSPKGGERIIDTCSCPGGKSFSAGIDMENRGEIFSFDLHKNKLSLIEKGALRLSIDIISVGENNANTPRTDLLGTADGVICDVPCSGLGIIAKKPDIKYKDEKDVKRLPEIQKSILENSSRYLKRGGRIVYSTCTLNPDENERVTDAFLSSHPDFKRAEGYPVTVFPKDGYEDGFFYDLIIKE